MKKFLVLPFLGIILCYCTNIRSKFVLSGQGTISNGKLIISQDCKNTNSNFSTSETEKHERIVNFFTHKNRPIDFKGRNFITL